MGNMNYKTTSIMNHFPLNEKAVRYEFLQEEVGCPDYQPLWYSMFSLLCNQVV